MAVSKYRDITEVAPISPAATPTENLRVAFDMIELCHRFRPIRPHRGVRRYGPAGSEPSSDSDAR